MQTRYIVVLGLLFSLLTIRAEAFDKGVYVGASVGQADVSISSTSNNINYKDSDTAYKVLIGVRPLKWLAVEGSYVDLGKPKDASYAAHPSGVSAFAVGLLDLGPVDLFAKAGAINWNSKISSAGVKLSQDGTDAAFGAGIQVSLLALKIRGEYERFEVDKGANMISVGLVFTFL